LNTISFLLEWPLVYEDVGASTEAAGKKLSLRRFTSLNSCLVLIGQYFCPKTVAILLTDLQTISLGHHYRGIVRIYAHTLKDKLSLIANNISLSYECFYTASKLNTNFLRSVGPVERA
jgi:hypothetical protein